MLKQIKKTPFNIVIICSVSICMIVFSIFSVKFSTIFYILISGVIGIFANLIISLQKKESKE